MLWLRSISVHHLGAGEDPEIPAFCIGLPRFFFYFFFFSNFLNFLIGPFTGTIRPFPSLTFFSDNKSPLNRYVEGFLPSFGPWNRWQYDSWTPGP